MTVEPFVPDVAPIPGARPLQPANPPAFAMALDALGAQLNGAQQAEDRYAAHRGTLADAVYERARADVAVAVATAAAQRATQALQAILNMQV